MTPSDVRPAGSSRPSPKRRLTSRSCLLKVLRLAAGDLFFLLPFAPLPGAARRQIGRRRAGVRVAAPIRAARRRVGCRDVRLADALGLAFRRRVDARRRVAASRVTDRAARRAAASARPALSS